jgi:hypothetical protein
MPRAEIASKQAVYTLGLLHAELAGKLLANKREAIRLRTAMIQVEAVLQMLQPGFNVASIAAKRRNKSNPWFKRGTLFRSAVDVMRRAGVPMTAREIADRLIADKAPQATRKQAIDLQAAILAALRKRDGGDVGWRGQPGTVAVGGQLRRPWLSKTEFNGIGGLRAYIGIVPAPFLPALLKFGHRCDGTGAVPGRQSHEKAVRRRARAAFFLGLKIGHSQIQNRPLLNGTIPGQADWTRLRPQCRARRPRRGAALPLPPPSGVLNYIGLSGPLPWGRFFCGDYELANFQPKRANSRRPGWRALPITYLGTW